MKKVIVCPDSFKGTLTSLEVCEIIKSAINEIDSNIIVDTMPIADGGEGTIDCIKQSLSGILITETVKNANGKKIEANYFLTDNCAVIESAKVIGLHQANPKNPLYTTTYGIGQLIKSALNKRINEIIFGKLG